MLPDASVDWTTLPRYIGWIAAQKPTAIAMNMDASEGPSLDRDEQLADPARVPRRDRRRVSAGLGADQRLDARRRALGQRAEGAPARRDSRCFRRSRRSSATRCPAEMIYQYHKAIADGVGLPLIAFQFPKAFGPDFPPETLARLCSIPRDHRTQGSVVRHDEDDRDDRRGEGAAAQARHPHRQRHVHLGSDGDGLRRRADRLRRHRDRRADRDAARGRCARLRARVLRSGRGSGRSRAIAGARRSATTGRG